MSKNTRAFLLSISALCIFLLGLVMVFDTSSAEVIDRHLEKYTWTSLAKQITYGTLGGILGVFIYQHRTWNPIRKSPLFLFLITCFLVMTLIPGIGKSVKGSHRWIQLGPVSFQPSEFAKFWILAFCIRNLLGKEKDGKVFIKTLAWISIPIGLVWIEPNHGTAFVMVLSVLILFFLMRVPFHYWGIPILVCAVLAAISVSQLPYAQRRIESWLNPQADIRGKGHQPYQAKIATGSGGLFGKGPSKSFQKMSYLPEAQNDYIAAIFAEEYGFVGMLVLINLYMLLVLFGYGLIDQTQSIPSYYLKSSVLFLIAFQAFLNLSVVSGLLPPTGINLPFFSQGGTSLVANTMFLGYILRQD